METIHKEAGRVHQGQNIRRLRQALGVKQEILADKLNTTQQTVSRYEQKEVLEEDVLLQIAKVLNVSPDLIKQMESDPLSIVIENNTFEEGSTGNNQFIGIVNPNDIQTINHPIDQIVDLFERFLSEEKRKNDLLEQLLKDKK